MTCDDVLLIDVDDTLIHQTPEPGCRYELLELIKQQAGHAGMDRNEVASRVQKVLDTTYWCWHDFLECLELDRASFWQLADDVEAQRTTRIDSRIEARLGRLRDKGYLLAITSNNPVDGIRHKLRLAGISSQDQEDLFVHYFGTDNCRANKAELTFWRYVVEHLGIPSDRISVVGDNPVEDGRVPSQVGIRRWFPIRNQDSSSGEATWSAVERQLLTEADSAQIADG